MKTLTKVEATNLREINSEIAMSSLRIAEVTCKAHDKVTKDIEDMLVELKIDVASFRDIYLDGSNRKQKYYLLPEREFTILISGYSIKYRGALIDELMSYRHNTKIISIDPVDNFEELKNFHNKIREVVTGTKTATNAQISDGFKMKPSFDSRGYAQFYNLDEIECNMIMA